MVVALKNPGWEQDAGPDAGSRPRPANWSVFTSNPLSPRDFALDSGEKRSGSYALRMTPPRDPKTGADYAFIVRSDNFRVNPSTDVVYSVWLKASAEDTPVDLALVDGTFKSHGVYTERVVVGREWRRYELKCRLYNELTTISVGLKAYRGTIWADDAAVEQVGGVASMGR